MGTAGFAVAWMLMASIITTYIDGKGLSDHQEIKIQRLLKQLNKPALKSIKSEDGDIIDCVLISSQPAFDHPLLKNHKIEMRPSFIPEDDSTYSKEKAITQVWHKNGESCPENTVPIRRVKREDILRAQSINSFGKKTSSPNILMVTSPNPDAGHEYAIKGVLGEGKFYGTKASINIWKPKVEVPNEFSLAQIWLVSGKRSSFNSIEAGWQVFPQIYGDNNTRLFIYWTRDGQKNTGCYNLLCQGFVQTSKQYSVGTSFGRVSQYGGHQINLNLLIWKEKTAGNWWLKISNEIMGYWPWTLFDSLGDGATQVQWGGEIYSKAVKRHTTTHMGSGHFADEGLKKASYFKNLKIVDEKNNLREPGRLYPSADNINCYNVKTGDAATSLGIHFFYGGPGRNGKCP